jgi:hypothetical protein
MKGESSQEHGTIPTESFVNPASLATQEWLVRRLDDPAIKVIDTRYTVEMNDRRTILGYRINDNHRLVDLIPTRRTKTKRSPENDRNDKCDAHRSSRCRSPRP